MEEKEIKKIIEKQNNGEEISDSEFKKLRENFEITKEYRFVKRKKRNGLCRSR